MGGGLQNDWELTPSVNIVLLGKAGNGKSATGNSILGRKAFVSKRSMTGVTSACEMQSVTLQDGRTINVIDTPGIFDNGSESAGKEIVNCINLAKKGIHAVLMVLSAGCRFTQEEDDAIRKLKSFFGDKIVDYMIIVFTHGDALEADGETLNDFISNACPEPVKNILESCHNRVMLFNNTTQDKNKRGLQVNELLLLVDLIAHENGGVPFSNDVFEQLKSLEKEEKEKEIDGICHDEQIKQLIKMIESRFDEAIKKLQDQLNEEKEARKRSEEEINELREKLMRKAEEGSLKGWVPTILTHPILTAQAFKRWMFAK